jgi:hypothetical protein
VDYIRNIGLHFLIPIDVNRTGDASFFNLTNALAARDKAQLANGCGAGPGQVGCMITALGVSGAQSAYSGAGLDSANAVTSGAPCPTCAFSGKSLDGSLGNLSMLFPIGRSVYNGMDVKLQHQVQSPIRGVKSANFQVSYSLSKFISPVFDQDFIVNPIDNNNPLHYTGPNALDRRHQISFGGFFDLPFFTRVGLIGHFYSPLPQNVALPQLTSGGEIFATDVTGDGTVGDLVPGTNVGWFQRNVGVSGLQGIINAYNSTAAGQLTPAGQQLVSNGVLTLADMQALGWVTPSLPSVAPGALNFPWLKTFDVTLGWPIPIGERVHIEPSIAFFNIFNMSNSFLPGNLPSQALNPADPTCTSNCTISTTSIGGVGFQQLLPYRATMQSGTYALGAPRQLEFGLKLSF